MVPVDNTQTEYILRDIYVYLLSKLKQIQPNSIECAFSCWIYPDGIEILQPVLPSDFSVTNYSHVAQLGYLITCRPFKFSSYADRLKDGLSRVEGRPTNILGMGKAPFCNDAIALLGLALGACHLGSESKTTMNKWLNSFVNLSTSTLPEWKKLLLQSAIWLTDSTTTAANNYSKNTVDFQLALLSRGIDCFSSLALDDAYQAALNGVIYEEPDIAVMSARLQLIKFLSAQLPLISLSLPTIEQLVKVLETLPAAFRRWVWEDKPKTSTGVAQRWDIQNEYHVQSLLYFVLAPLFPDIESEFYLESIGQLNSRADIGIPSLSLIIEVKFLRKSKTFQNMLEEIAADNSIYFKKESVYKDKYSKMLVFLWDDTNRNHEHGTFKNGAKGLSNIVGSVVISRPGIMNIKSK